MHKNARQGQPSKLKTDFEISSWVPTKMGKQKLGSYWRVTL